MRHNIILLAFAAVCSLPIPARAQTIGLKGTVERASADSLELYVSPLSQADATPPRLTIGSDNRFAGAVAPAPDGFYTLYGRRGQMPVEQPFYVAPDQQMPSLRLTFADGCAQLLLDRNNRALSAFNLVVWQKQREIWNRSDTMGVEGVRAFLRSYKTSADSLLQAYEVAAPVARYMRIWADMAAYSGYSAAQHIMGSRLSPSQHPFRSLYPVDLHLLDSDLSLYFTESALMLNALLPRERDVERKLEHITDSFGNEQVRRRLYDYVMGRFIASYHYAEAFDAGLATVERITARYRLPDTYVKAFRIRQVTLSGKPFPASVTLVDAGGNPVSFDALRGYYVYVDLWASWCVPCIKETPYLQKLEEELQNPLVKFVSISIDRNELAWKKKMEQLGSRGLQWLNADNAVSAALNVKAIPFFLVYDREGRLLRYDAPRPSDPQLKTYLESLK